MLCVCSGCGGVKVYISTSGGGGGVKSPDVEEPAHIGSYNLLYIADKRPNKKEFIWL